METDLPAPVATLLVRTGALLGLTAAGCALMAGIASQEAGPSSPASVSASRPDTPAGVMSQHETDLSNGEIQVAVAEIYLFSPDEWENLLADLAADLRLGLVLDGPLPSTRSEEPPPADSLNRLLWAKSVLRRHRIELRVEQDSIRLVPLESKAAVPAEA